MRASLSELEELVDSSGVASILETALPKCGRPRQLPARTLLLGMLLATCDDRPAHLTRVHDALVVLPDIDKRRLSVTVTWRGGDHLVTYRQLEHMTRRLRSALRGDNGKPSAALSLVVDGLLEASVPDCYKDISADLAVDWTDHETFARPASPGDLPSADPDAAWGHRKGDGPGQSDELFYGYYLQFATMVGEVGKEPVPELVRRMLLSSARVDPPPAFVEVLERLVASAVRLGDVLSDCGYSFRSPQHWAHRLRSLGASLVQDLHPADRGPKGTEGGAIIANGCLYCPATPMPLLSLGPLRQGASSEEVTAHDNMTAELSAYKLGPISSHDSDGYHRVCCPAVSGKLRCPLRVSSLSLPFDRPEVIEPPREPPRCCGQKTITVPPSVAPKTAQRHDYPGRAWRESYGRRSAAERSNSTMKDPARTTTERGWCRLMGLEAITLFLVCAVVVRNMRVVKAFEARADNERRRALEGRPPRSRRRRRTPLDELAGAGRRQPP